jgi:Domain of unknown function (DUF4157)
MFAPPVTALRAKTVLHALASDPLKLSRTTVWQPKSFAGNASGLAWDLRNVSVFPPGRTAFPMRSAGQTVQTKLAINRPGDEYEQEADRVADAVMRMPEPGGSPEPEETSAVHRQTGGRGFVQRLEAHRNPSLEDAIVVEEEQSMQETVQTLRTQSQQSGTTAIPKEQLNQAAGGMPLESRSRNFMEARFGADFSRVQVHADQHAAALCESISARAFTYGSHIYFGTSEYRPETEAGRRVLAHELTHVVQQGGGEPATPASRSPGGSQIADSAPAIQRLGALGKELRRNVAPWGAGGPTGIDHEVATDVGTTVTGWQAYSPYKYELQYWCHGHSTNSFYDYSYSVYSGTSFAKVIVDEWTNIPPAQAAAGDIAVWTASFDHSARFTRPVIENGQLSADKSMLSTKNGQNPLAQMSLSAIAGVYGGVGVGIFRHK